MFANATAMSLTLKRSAITSARSIGGSDIHEACARSSPRTPARNAGPSGDRAAMRDVPHGLQTSSTPDSRWSFASPSGSAIRPSTTIGLFQ
jgi:hypothetical protein